MVYSLKRLFLIAAMILSGPSAAHEGAALQLMVRIDNQQITVSLIGGSAPFVGLFGDHDAAKDNRTDQQLFKAFFDTVTVQDDQGRCAVEEPFTMPADEVPEVRQTYRCKKADVVYMTVNIPALDEGGYHLVQVQLENRVSVQPLTTKTIVVPAALLRDRWAG